MFWETALSTEDRLAVLRQTFFAPGNYAGVWQDGWNFEVAGAQRASDSRMALDEWWAGGAVPMLVIYGAEDKIAIPANAKSLATEFPDRVTLVEVSKAG